MSDFDSVEWEAVETEDQETRYDQISDMLEPPEIPDVQEEPPKPDADLLKDRSRSRKEREYAKKVRKVFGMLTRVTITRPATVPDAAAFLLYGPKVSDSVGRLAAEHDAITGAVDIIDTLNDSPYIALATSLAPLAMQLARNHEPILEPAERTLTIPVIKRRVKIPKIGFRLGVARSFTNEPQRLVEYVLSDPDVQKALARNGITLT